ncbi:YciI family protein [Streptomyces sp. NPDC089799]|uniref:YciI family protein n=1 Tax=Streptomyces sp. NPDC089799 TaxID=3155066 RepID=UPI0034378DE4
MEFFCYHRDRAGSAALRMELLERHWSYMDRYEKELIARGPTFGEDGETPTGSVHIVDLPDAAAARAFAFEEPGYQAGVYRDVLLRRWRNLLGRTMWEFPGGRSGGNRYLVIGLGPASGAGPTVGLDVPAEREDLIAYGPLLSDDGATRVGTAALVRAPDADAARAVLALEGCGDGHGTGNGGGNTGRYADVEVHEWEFGGRR